MGLFLKEPEKFDQVVEELKKIPAIVAKLEDDFPDQLDDLESGYRKLIEQNYHFPEKNIERRFQEIREAIRSNSSELVSLDLDRSLLERPNGCNLSWIISRRWWLLTA